MELQILNTINSLRKKDPKIYDPSTKWFEKTKEEDDSCDDEEGKPKKEKKKTFKTILREQLLESGAGEDEEDVEEVLKAVQHGRAKRNTDLAYDAEQKGLRESIIRGITGQLDDGNSDDEDEELLTVKKKSKEEETEEEEKVKVALQEMQALGDTLTSEGDRFLSDYFSNRRWKDKISLSISGEDDKGVEAGDIDDEEHLDEVLRRDFLSLSNRDANKFTTLLSF